MKFVLPSVFTGSSAVALASKDLLFLTPLVAPDGSSIEEAFKTVVVQSVFIYPVSQLRLVKLSKQDSQPIRIESVMKMDNSSLELDGNIVVSTCVESTATLLEELKEDFSSRNFVIYLRGNKDSFSSEKVTTHIVVTETKNTKQHEVIGGGLIYDLDAVMTTALSKIFHDSRWIVDIGCTLLVSDNCPGSFPHPLTTCPLGGLTFHRQEDTIDIKSQLAICAMDKKQHCPTSTRFLIKTTASACSANIFIPLVCNSNSITARKELHRLLGFPSSVPALTQEFSIGRLEDVFNFSNSKIFELIFPPDRLTSIATECNLTSQDLIKDIELISSNKGEPEKILRLVNIEGIITASSPKTKGGSQLSCVASKVINLQDLRKAKDIPRASCFIVRCPLDYYHYKIDGFDDSGWGCAYRSSQLILSWFQRMGMTKKAIPSLRHIQEILFNIDPDKQNKRGFVGSKDWIGSYEVMMILQYFIPELDCTIRRMESGKELDKNPEIQRLLLTHFEKGGAPVMIGGSSYAHTIIGIDVNMRASESQYLIVDPHYPANVPNVSHIIQKGWIGWKDASKFFEEKSWYNLCIPRNYDYDVS